MFQADRQRRHPQDLLRRVLPRPEEPGGGAPARDRSHRSRSGRTGRRREVLRRPRREERRNRAGARRLRLAGSGGLGPLQPHAIRPTGAGRPHDGANAVTDPPRGPKTRVLLISEDDDIGGPLEAVLRRAGYAAEVVDAREGAGLLRGGAPGTAAGGYPDALILDRDLPPDRYRTILDLLAPRGGPASFPLLVLGGGSSPQVPAGWHEDAFASVARPPQPAEITATLALLRRLGFYRRYRDLVHDLAQPVMTLHALSRGIAKLPVAEEAARITIERLVREADRLMSLLENFQRSRGGA